MIITFNTGGFHVDVLRLAGGCAILCATDILSLASLHKSPGAVAVVLFGIWEVHQLASAESHYCVDWCVYCVTVYVYTYVFFKLCGDPSHFLLEGGHK